MRKHEVFFTDRDWQYVRVTATLLGISAAELIRRALRAYLVRYKEQLATGIAPEQFANFLAEGREGDDDDR